MNEKFERYLMLLKSRAPESQKADYRNALELYRANAAKPRMEAELPMYGRNYSQLGKSPSLNTFQSHGQGLGNAKRTPEMVAADEKRAAALRNAEETFPVAADTVTKAAEVTPGKVDAWVDYRLRPVINRARKEDGLGGVEGSKAKYKSEYKAAKAQYKSEDAEARENEKREREDALARAREMEETQKAEEARKADEDRMADAEKKRESLGTNRDYKFTPDMPLNSTDADINRNVATARSEDLAKGEEADRQAREAEKYWSDNGETAEFGTPMSDEEVAKDQAERKRMADFADSFNFDDWGMPDVAAVNIKGLRATFESVYGDSKDFSDNEIRTICESCYRRSRKK